MAYAGMMHGYIRSFPRAPTPLSVSDPASTERYPANAQLDPSLELCLEKSVRQDDSIDNEHVYAFHETLTVMLRKLAPEHPPSYIPRQLSKVIEWLDYDYNPLQSAEEPSGKRLARYERTLAVFTQLAYCPDQVETFLNIPVINHSPVVKQQEVLDTVALRLWSRAGNANTTVQLLRFAQNHAPDGAAVAHRFVAHILDFWRPGREREMAELMRLLPGVLPAAEMNELENRLQESGLWQIALGIGQQDVLENGSLD